MNHRISIGLLLAGILAFAAAVFMPASTFHPVTPMMLNSAQEQKGVRVPEMMAEGSDGRITSPSAIAKDRPTVLIFIKEGCPCSEAIEPFLHRLHTAYGARAAFLGVIDGDRSAAKEWAERHQSPYPVLADPDLRIIQACGAERSAYVALVDRGGTIDRLWPGYSAEMLAEFGGRLADLTGLAKTTIDVTNAPSVLSSGCSF